LIHCKPLKLMLYLSLLVLWTASSPLADSITNPGICLSRTPAPPASVSNCGDQTVRFDWCIKYNTTCSSPYVFEILDSTFTPVPGLSQNYVCAASTIQNSYIWNVDQSIAPGCYYGRLSFYSNWCNGLPRTLEDPALVSVLVTAGARVTICKFRDVNGNHIRDVDITNPPNLEPLIPNWQFQIERPQGVVVLGPVSTDQTGCVTVCLPVLNGQTIYYIREIIPPNEGWVQRAPVNGGGNPVNPYPITVTPGAEIQVLFGNWQPITLSGFKFLDMAPWPWGSGLNPPGYEPTPTCPQPIPSLPCDSPTQPNQQGIEGVTVRLFSGDGVTQIAQTVTGPGGAFSFGPISWEQNFVIKVDTPAPDPPECPTDTHDVPPACVPGFQPWPGENVGTVATSPYPCPNINFVTPDRLDLILPPPTVANQNYGCNYFFNRHPSRLWGLICPPETGPVPSVTITVNKDGVPWPAGNPSSDPACGFYILEPLAAEPQGIRQGLYRLAPPAPQGPDFFWEVTTYCNNGSGNVTFPLPHSGFVDVNIPPGTDVRVDFCQRQKPPNERRCFLPVTFTQVGWNIFCNPDNGIIPDGMVFNKFKNAFAKFKYYDGVTYTNKMIVGDSRRGPTITYDGTTNSLTRLCLFLPQTGPCGKLDRSYSSPWAPTPAGALAGEIIALQMNIAYNDKRLMPRTPGYDLECFTIASGVFKGKKVGQVLDIANQVLSGAPPCQFGLSNCQELVDILAAINANYEFVDFNTFNDRGYLIPNRPLGQPDPPHDPEVPFVPC